MIYTLGDYVKLLSEEKLVTYENVDKNAAVEHISYNSRDVRPGTLFICKGAHFKAEYLADAEKAGAVCYVGEQRLGADFPCIIVSDVRRAISLISNKFFDKPWEKLSLIGITGTKGKSTTTYFMRYILDEYLKAVGKPRSGVISSIDTYDGVENFESHLTTPEPIELFRHFDNAVKSGIGYMTMEVSSQALKYGRVDCVSFDVGCYLNIGYDHISDIEHPDFEDYFHSKLKLFSKCKTACVCMDGERCDEVLKACRACERVITFSGIDKNADVFGYNIRKSGSDTVFDVRTPDFEGEFTLTIPGLFNVQNALAAIGRNLHADGEENIQSRQQQHDARCRQQRQQHAEGCGDALAAAEMVKKTDGMPQHRRGHHGGKQQTGHIEPLTGHIHRQKTLHQVEPEAQQPHGHAAGGKHIRRTGVVIGGVLGDVLAQQQLRQQSAEHDAAQQKAAEDPRIPKQNLCSHRVTLSMIRSAASGGIFSRCAARMVSALSLLCRSSSAAQTASFAFSARTDMPCAEKNAAFFVSQPEKARICTRGMVATAASVLESPPGLEIITSDAFIYRATSRVKGTMCSRPQSA